MITMDQLSQLGENVYAQNGDKLGSVGQVYLDDQTGRPDWITVKTGLFGTKESFAPLRGSAVRGDRLVLAVSRELVKDAPTVDDDGHLSDAEASALYQHYAAYQGSGARAPRTPAVTRVARPMTAWRAAGPRRRDTTPPGR